MFSNQVFDLLRFSLHLHQHASAHTGTQFLAKLYIVTDSGKSNTTRSGQSKQRLVRVRKSEKVLHEICS